MAYVMAAITAVTAAYSIYSGERSAKLQEQAQEQAKANADRQAKLADEATNRANQKKPDVSAILADAQQAGKAGASGTMLTGTGGIDPNALTLGKNSLLGS